MGSSAEPGGHSETAGLLLCLTAHQTGWEGWGPAGWSGVWRVLQIDFWGAWGWGEAGMSGPGLELGGGKNSIFSPDLELTFWEGCSQVVAPGAVQLRPPPHPSWWVMVRTRHWVHDLLADLA